LVAVSALAVTLNRRVLQPGYLNRRLYGQYLTGLICSIILPALVAVLVIGWIYDVLWGPDPMRFGFWRNLAYETIFIGVHVLIAMAVIWLARRLRRSDPE
jgi:hypothetical protein